MRLEVIDSLRQVDPAQWDALCGQDDPFVEHRFLLALEESGCVGAGTGWLPRHLLVHGGGRLCGAAPLYLKHDSFGEYIFDWSWAEASAALGEEYYPKLVCAIPFTPTTGRRLLILPGAREEAVAGILLRGMAEVAEQAEASSIHILFHTAAERTLIADHDLGAFAPRLTYQFRWDNQGYQDFDHYLSTFRSSARKSVRRERRRVAAAGLTIDTLRGDELDDGQWQAIYGFYRDTTSRKWGQAYLNRAFFERVRETLASRAVVVLASQGDRAVAGSISFQRGKRLYGRYWGCAAEFDSLHFELCYYRTIELCIASGWDHFEAGAQGVHKLKRGLMPGLTHSAHWLRHPVLRELVRRFVAREQRAVRRDVAHLARHGPFKREDGAAAESSASGSC